MDFSMNSSVVLVAIVGLWLIWVAPYVLRIRRPALLVETAETSALIPPATAESNVSQGSIMEMSGHTNDAATPRPAGSSPRSASSQQRFVIRPARTAIAATGALALLAAIVCLPLAILAVVPALLPPAAFVLFLLAVAGLRVLAVRDRRRRVNAAFAEAMYAPAATTQPAPLALHAPRRETSLFDAETSRSLTGENSVAEEHRPAAAAPLTATELRQAALAVATGADSGTAGEEGAPLDPAVSGGSTPAAHAGGDTWEPVEVPKPMYVAAAKAERQAPAPLELPDAPKAQARTSLKQGAVPPVVENTEQTTADNATTAPPTGRLNLDDVLQRRRA
ncbi:MULTISPECIES: hypothetical protein [unclassified Arthrobacter]|uniref:hypothetical protein n=1 Tax=unclassified Arthrobacter TaxID=235627 RepID=UPI001491E400|nr:hypothetical protein [Arthrobacter sp. AET 35A]MBE0008871.1 hypothetical protein [Arthrobacter sp. AET 35A]NOJ62649.1 hypothetical protein [Arthrobacter sp. 147(2020)]